MVSKGIKYLIGLIVIILITLFLGFVFTRIIGANVCGFENPTCEQRFFFKWFFPVCVLSFLALLGLIGIGLLCQKLG